MAYTGKKPVEIKDVSSAQSLNVSEDLTVDTNTLKVDSTNNRVGIGTTSPNYPMTIHKTGDGIKFEVSDTVDANYRIQVSGSNIITGPSTSSAYIFQTGNTERMRIDSSGQVGIGTSSPVSPLEIATTNKLGSTFTGTTNGEGLTVTQTNYTAGNYVSLVEAAFDDSNDVNPNVRIGAMFNGSGSNLAFGTSNSYGNGITNTAMFINSSGNVGIGTSSPSSALHVVDSGNPTLTISGSDGAYTSFLKLQAAGGGGSVIDASGATSDQLIFTITGSERMRIDSSGNLLVGQTSANSNAVGIGALSYGSLYSTRDGGSSLLLNRKTSDGDIALFQKDGTTVGKIGSRGSGTSFITLKATSGAGAGLTGSDNRILPMDESALADNNTDLGMSSYRFKDLYLGGGIYLGGTGSANHLDDYEEGTFSFSWNGGGSVATYYAKYVKIGRLVHINCDIQLPASSSTSTAVLSGLPFNHSDSYSSLMAISYNNKSDTHLIFLENNNEVKIRTSMSGGRATCANITAGRYVFSGSYYTNA